jgi:diguanylate cyclase (GGDEF)-like protein
MDKAAVRRSAPSLVASRNPVICIVDDDDIYRQYLAALLKANNCKVLEASRGLELIDMLEKHAIDCVLLDYDLVAENGLYVHQQIKDRFRDAPPIVMLTGETNERTIIKAFRGGISDYVLKRDLRSDELFIVLANALAQRDDQKAKQEELSRLRQKSDFDDATGLYTTQYMEERLARLAGGRQQARYAAILITPAKLEETGAKFGQAVRDRALRMFATRLRAVTRQNDICGRYQADKFIYLVDIDVRHKSISAICARLASDLSLGMNFDGLSLNLAPAIGAAIYPFDGDTTQIVLAGAEQALEQSKAGAIPYVVASAPSADERDAEHAEPEAGPRPAMAPGAAATTSVTFDRRADRRTVRRQRVLRRGQIFLPTVPSAIECTIRDISSRGARLRVNAPLLAPERFEVTLGNSTERTQVTLRWQAGNEIGVQFLQIQPQFDQ